MLTIPGRSNIIGYNSPFQHLGYLFLGKKGRIFFSVLPYRFASLLVYWNSFHANGTQKLYRVGAVEMLAAPTILLANIQRAIKKIGLLHQF
jgi:hypothetical protein